MKKIMAIAMIVLCFIAFTVPSANADDPSGRMISSVVKGVFELAKIIKQENPNPDLVIGETIGFYKLNGRFQVVQSKAKYKSLDAIVFSTHDEKTKQSYYYGFTTDDKKCKEFNDLKTDRERKEFIKAGLNKYIDVGRIEAEPSASSQSATIADAAVPSAK